MNTASIVSRVWSFCTTLRDDGVSYGDYLEQLTYLIFLKMADEYARPPFHAARAEPRDGGMCASGTRQDHRRSCVWDRRVFPGLLRLHQQRKELRTRQEAKGVPETRHV